jgi:hypothetical protein
LFNLSVCAQKIINISGSQTNEVIQQIHNSGIDNIMKFQTFNQGLSNNGLTQQTGNQNNATVHQQNGATNDINNQTFSIQAGNSNELNIQQIGSGNLLLGFQLGYLSSLHGNKTEIKANSWNMDLNYTVNANDANSYLIEGERNKMNILQNGSNNGVMVVQQGTDNSISAEQLGKNNNLMSLQKGTNNKVIAYKQENNTDHVLYDKIIQMGENINLETIVNSNSALKGNTFIQSGTNLSLQVNNGLSNSVGGIEVNQKGSEMKVIVDQSYFSFPLR